MKKSFSILMVLGLSVLLAVGASSKTVLRGDVDGDGSVTPSDARTALRAAAQLESLTDEQILIADVDGSGKLTAQDARLILRTAAKLDPDLGEIELDSDEPSEKTELMSGFGQSISGFEEAFGCSLTKQTTADNIAVYSDSFLTVLSDPAMITVGRISSILLTGGDYTLCGVSVGMSKEEAVSILKAANWTVKQDSGSAVTLSSAGMLIKLTVADGLVESVEYCLAESIVPSEPTTEEPSTEEPTTEEPTTEEPATEEPSTEEPATDEPATEEPATQTPATEPPAEGDLVSYENFPSQLKAFISGKFSMNAKNYSENGIQDLALMTDGTNVRIGMSLDDVAFDALVIDGKLYLLSSEKKIYYSGSIPGMSTDDLDFNYALSDADETMQAEIIEKTFNGEVYTVYRIVTEEGTVDAYMLGDDLKRILSYDSAGNIMTQMDIDSITGEVPEDAFSLDGYTKKLTLTSFMMGIM